MLVSPALHQIHHSKAVRHHDRNYGEVFAIWDLLQGTLFRPRGREVIEFGLTDEPEQPHRNLASALAEPFSYAARRLVPARVGQAPPAAAGPPTEPSHAGSFNRP